MIGTGEKGGSGPGSDARTGLLRYVAVGLFFGVALTKSEVISWFRIQEMFRFQSFHMYGILGSAVVVAAASLAAFRWSNRRTGGRGEPAIPRKERTPAYRRYWMGGFLFGVGWALLGACPGPIYALIGNGVSVYLLALVSALAGTWMYGWLRPRLPH